MKVITILSICFCMFSFAVNGQNISPEVISTTGDSYKTSTIHLSWTIGEPIIETTSNPNAVLTQGFHQATYQLTSLLEKKDLDFKIMAFPNPTNGLLNITTEPKNIEFSYNIIGIDGTIIYKSSIKNHQQIDLSTYNQGSFILQIQSTKNSFSKSYKIIKTN